jgi:hypothetical protein
MLKNNEVYCDLCGEFIERESSGYLYYDGHKHYCGDIVLKRGRSRCAGKVSSEIGLIFFEKFFTGVSAEEFYANPSYDDEQHKRNIDLSDPIYSVLQPYLENISEYIELHRYDDE